MKIQNNRLIYKYGSLYISVSVVSMDCEYVTGVSTSHIRNLIINIQ
jgi:hypothetical protein